MSSVPSSNVSITSLGRLFHTLIDLVVRGFFFFFLQPNSPQNMKELRQESNSLDFFFSLVSHSSAVSLGCA